MVVPRESLGKIDVNCFCDSDGYLVIVGIMMIVIKTETMLKVVMMMLMVMVAMVSNDGNG